MKWLNTKDGMPKRDIDCCVIWFEDSYEFASYSKKSNVWRIWLDNFALMNDEDTVNMPYSLLEAPEQQSTEEVNYWVIKSCGEVREGLKFASSEKAWEYVYNKINHHFHEKINVVNITN